MSKIFKPQKLVFVLEQLIFFVLAINLLLHMYFFSNQNFLWFCIDHQKFCTVMLTHNTVALVKMIVYLFRWVTNFQIEMEIWSWWFQDEVAKSLPWSFIDIFEITITVCFVKSTIHSFPSASCMLFSSSFRSCCSLLR
uniref:Uncharacterized protein n=1 Tax=Cucumis melo TaxID=3656 RepID=A0A9I9E862_CUCME